MGKEKIKKYLTKTDKIIGRVTAEYAQYEQLKHLKKVWKEKIQQTVVDTLPHRLSERYHSFDFSKLIKQNPISLYIHGRVGTGKSVASAYYYVDFVKSLYFKQGYFSGISYNFVVMSAFLDYLQKDFQDSQNLVKKYCECDLLVLDEFGAKKMTEFVLDTMYLIINERYLSCLPTIINSNNSLQELISILDDERIVRRIEEDYAIIEKTPYK